ncbi:MAG TPA: ABC transporter permease [Candidatus Binataceae bacterium]|jgi:phospholipid/cholesterol/gamma-HCH transport system permease protein|nr:ABC transporter permease [Candidatus Binataceae bacterium]
MESTLTPTETPAEHRLSYGRLPDGTLMVTVGGSWNLNAGLPSLAEFESALDGQPPRRVAFDCRGLRAWDSSLVTYLTEVARLADEHHLALDRAGLPAGARRLLELAEAVPEKRGGRAPPVRAGLLARVGMISIGCGVSVGQFLAFLGEVGVAARQFLRGRARFRQSDFLLILQECGADALGIVTLIAFLVGTILAFMGAVQLRRFGASIYVADMVAIGVVREMGAMMTAIIMAGRTGAAFAAQLGTMKVTQEIDALTTIGISPMEFLVLPRLIALTLMMPLLTVYADLVAMVGGASIGTLMLHLPMITYYQETLHALTLTQLFGGLFKATAYGVLIALAGCLRGFQCGQSSSAVGDAATAAVVTSIVLVVSACGLFAWVFDVLDI